MKAITNNKRYDVIIIGSGIGGSTAALMLAKFFNKSVLLLEKHWKYGGLTHEFEFDNKMFATGIHYIGSVQNKSIPAKIFDILTDGKLIWKQMPHKFDELIFPKHSYTIPSSPEDFQQELAEKYPEDKKALTRFIKQSKQAFTYLNLHNTTKNHLPFLHGMVTSLFKLLVGFNPNVTLQEYLDRNFQNDELKAIIAGQWCDHGVVPSEASFMVHSMIFNHYIHGAYYPEGGVSSFNKNMHDTLIQAGVDISVNSHVKRLKTSKNKVVGIEVEMPDGHVMHLEADQYISNIGAPSTYKNLLAQENFSFLKADQEHLSSNYDFFTIYLSLNRSPKHFGFDGSNKWICNSQARDHQLLLTDQAQQPGFYCLLFPSLKAGDDTNHTMEILSMVNYEVFKKWEDTTWKQRDKEYNVLKDQLAKQIFEDIKKRYPGLMDAVSAYNISTPLTTTKFLSREKGSSYGVPFTTRRPTLKWLSAKTPYKNLHLSGQDVFAPGIMAAMMGGISAAANTLGSLGYFKLMKQITQYKIYEKKPPLSYFQVKVKKRVEETAQAASFILDHSGNPELNYKAGQFVLVDVAIQGRSHKRSYSLSSYPEEDDLKITVKRVKNGLVSNYLLDQVFEGGTLSVSSPKGKLIIPNELKSRDILCIAAGSGITPIFSIINDLLVNACNNKIRLVYANKSPASSIFLDELKDLEVKYPSSLTLEHFYSSPSKDNLPRRLSKADITKAFTHFEGDKPLVVVCAPGGIVKMAKEAALDFGLPEELLMYESFTTEPVNLNKAILPDLDSSITLQISNREFQGKVERGKTLLKGMLNSKIPVDHSCMSGDCGLCACTLKSGQVISVEGKKAKPKTVGEEILPCISYANSKNVELLKN